MAPGKTEMGNRGCYCDMIGGHQLWNHQESGHQHDKRGEICLCLFVCMQVCTNQSDKKPTLVPGCHSLTIITGLCLWRVEGCYAHLDIHSFDDTE